MALNNLYTSLPFGSVKPEGWLLKTLRLQAEGLTGSLDKIEPRPGFKNNPVREDSVWRGGHVGRDFLEVASERAPYYLRGLVTTAYLLDDKKLKEKAAHWLDYWFNTQDAAGNLKARGVHYYEWWPRMLIADCVRFYHDFTGDDRALGFISRYFDFQLKNLEKHPLTKNIRYLPEWRSWASLRGADNMASAAWLYALNGDPDLLKLAGLLNSQTYAWEKYFLENKIIDTHAVNLAHGLRKPVVQYQWWPEDVLQKASAEGFEKTLDQHGHASGSISGDEQTSGRGPAAGAELCTTIEYMRTLQSALCVFGGFESADNLEKLAFNALPAALAPDFKAHQYFSQANQVYCTAGYHGFWANKTDPPPPIGPWYRDALTFGAPAGYQCCIYNFHLGWPLFISSMWARQGSDTLAALLYGPCRLSTSVNGINVSIAEETGYPFSEKIEMHIYCDRPVEFELSLRIPGWCSEGLAVIDGSNYMAAGGSKLSIRRKWKNSETVTLVLPMQTRLKEWPENAYTVERGPLVFVLNPEEEWFSLNNSLHFPTYEVVPAGENPYKNSKGKWDFAGGPVWNYGLKKDAAAQAFQTSQYLTAGENFFPWSPDSAPLKIRLNANRLPQWQRTTRKREGGLGAGPLPGNLLKNGPVGAEEEITLIPYGASNLRIAIFPGL